MTVLFLGLVLAFVALVVIFQGRREETRRNLREFERIEQKNPRLPGDYGLC